MAATVTCGCCDSCIPVRTSSQDRHIPVPCPTLILQGRPDVKLAALATIDAEICSSMAKSVTATMRFRNPTKGLNFTANAPNLDSILDEVGVRGEAEKEQVRRFLRRDSKEWSRWVLLPCHIGEGGCFRPPSGR